jgi:hypothetical protein
MGGSMRERHRFKTDRWGPVQAVNAKLAYLSRGSTTPAVSSAA